ncbi:unnamed protein product [Protopolystoma xenopodis]|uniref:Uncharacterized protein n=1 Tax=Protopolystoma xenopodis TaxID=117903 RepID=A0A3S5A0F9_9PLAT|nr:unnamed protein product [Protopolystoma xenopodis]
MKEEKGYLDVVRQFAREVVDFSSQYGEEGGSTYTVSNLTGPPTVYPLHSDGVSACVFRTYGTWWRECPSALPLIAPHLSPPGFSSEDYVDIFLDCPVILRRIEIFETYNPGSVVRILACCRGVGGPSGNPIIKRCKLSDNADQELLNNQVPVIDVQDSGPVNARRLHWVTIWKTDEPCTKTRCVNGFSREVI